MSDTIKDRLDAQDRVLTEILGLVRRDRLKPYLTVDEAAAESGTSVATINRAINAGLLATTSPLVASNGSKPRPIDKNIISRAAFDAWMEGE